MIKLIQPTKSHNKPKLLLHTCCACCATEVYERLRDEYDVTLFWYNPNIEPLEEYKNRLDSFIKLVSDLKCDYLICHSRLDRESISDLLVDPRVKPEDDRKWEIENQKWQSATSKLENEPEGGKRCEKCYQFRLEKTAQVAKENGFDNFATTLTISPHKNASTINQIGEKVASRFCHPEFISGSQEMLKQVQHDKEKLVFLSADFKKQDGFKKSIQLSHKHNLYRQNYCGCIYSKGS